MLALFAAACAHPAADGALVPWADPHAMERVDKALCGMRAPRGDGDKDHCSAIGPADEGYSKTEWCQHHFRIQYRSDSSNKAGAIQCQPKAFKRRSSAHPCGVGSFHIMHGSHRSCHPDSQGSAREAQERAVFYCNYLEHHMRDQLAGWSREQLRGHAGSLQVDLRGVACDVDGERNPEVINKVIAAERVYHANCKKLMQHVRPPALRMADPPVADPPTARVLKIRSTGRNKRRAYGATPPLRA
jgi:hypothetical protein